MILAYNGTVTLVRGDTCKIPLADILPIEYKDYTLTGNDTIYFGLMLPRQPFEQALIKKVISITEDTPLKDILITLTSNETVELTDRKYFYSIKLLKNHTETIEGTEESNTVDEVVTLVNKTKFIICD